jgi:hypothetical protein
VQSLIVGALVLVLGGCSSTGPFDASPEDADATATVDVTAAPVAAQTAAAAARTSGPRTQPEGSVEGVVRVSKEADSKEKRLVFRGVEIERQGKPPLVVTYGADDLWRALDGERVWLKYEPYVPEGRAIGGEHARVTELWVVDDAVGKRYVGFGPAKKMNGELRERVGDKGTKSEGQKMLVFVDAAGSSHKVLNPPAPKDEKLGKVEIVARAVELSRFAAHLDMPAIWLTSVE